MSTFTSSPPLRPNRPRRPYAFPYTGTTAPRVTRFSGDARNMIVAARVVKKLKRRRARSLMHRQYKCFGRPVRYISMNAMVGAVRGTVNELGSRPGLRHGDGGPRAAGAERISGCREPYPEGPTEGSTEALGRRASHARRDWSSPRPQSPHRGRNGGATGHYPGLVPQACRPHSMARKPVAAQADHGSGARSSSLSFA